MPKIGAVRPLGELCKIHTMLVNVYGAGDVGCGQSRRPIISFWSWVEKTSVLSTTNELLAKALNYASNQRGYLETFMEDWRLPLTNNLCFVQELIRPFTTARRAWLFVDIPKGAKASAVRFTLAESARINDLGVYGYLKYLLMEVPNDR